MALGSAFLLEWSAICIAGCASGEGGALREASRRASESDSELPLESESELPGVIVPLENGNLAADPGQERRKARSSVSSEKESGCLQAQWTIQDKIEELCDGWRTAIARERGRVFLLATEHANVLGKLSSRDRERADLVQQLAEGALTLEAQRQNVQDHANQLTRLSIALAEASRLNERQGTQLRILSSSAFVRLRQRILAVRRLISRAKRLVFLRAPGNPLFDEKYYLETYPDVALAGIDAYAHYLIFGAGEHRNPNAMFDTAWYVSRYPDVLASGMNPLGHYYLYGAAELRDSHPLFSTRWYLEQTAEARLPGMNPLQHFLQASRGALDDDAGVNR
jgi:hypothetical protein